MNSENPFQADMRHQDFRVPSREERDSRYGSEFYYNDRNEKERAASPVHSSEVPHSSFESRYYDSQHDSPSRRDPFER